MAEVTVKPEHRRQALRECFIMSDAGVDDMGHHVQKWIATGEKRSELFCWDALDARALELAQAEQPRGVDLGVIRREAELLTKSVLFPTEVVQSAARILAELDKAPAAGVDVGEARRLLLELGELMSDHHLMSAKAGARYIAALIEPIELATLKVIAEGIVESLEQVDPPPCRCPDNRAILHPDKCGRCGAKLVGKGIPCSVCG